MLMAKVADLYYLRDLTQQEIAERLGISRPMVSRLLQRSRAEGIVRIEVIPPNGVHHDLERELEERFALREAIVTQVDRKSYLMTDEAPAYKSIGKEFSGSYAEKLVTARNKGGGVLWR